MKKSDVMETAKKVGTAVLCVAAGTLVFMAGTATGMVIGATVVVSSLPADAIEKVIIQCRSAMEDEMNSNEEEA